jgi:hypothetical protein
MFLAIISAKNSIGVCVLLHKILLKNWKIVLTLIASSIIITYALVLYFHSGESFALDFSKGQFERVIHLKEGELLKFYFSVPQDGFSGLGIKLKSAPKEPDFSIQIILRKLYKQSIVVQKIISSQDIDQDGFLTLHFNPVVFSQGTEFELAISNSKSALDSNLEFIVLAPDDRIRSLPTIYNTSALEGSLPVKFHFTKPLFIWRLLLNNLYIVLTLTTILSFLLFRSLPERYRYIWAIFYFSIILMLPTYVIISPDEEGFYNSLIGAILKTRTLAAGNLPFWDSFHGIGMPYNTVSSINWHPIWLLLHKVPLSVVVSILYHLHALIGLYAMYGLARLVGMRNPTAFLCALSYICSTQGITYIFGENFWPAGMIPLMLIPLILFFLIKFLYAEGSGARFLYSFSTSASMGFLALNCHLGMVLIMSIGLSIYLSMNWRRLIERWPWVLLVGCLIVVIAAPRFTDVLEELRRYPPGDNNYVRHYVDPSFLGLLFWPAIDVKRGLAFGGPFFILSLVGIFWPGLKSVHRFAFSVSIIGCYLIWFVPLSTFLPNNWGINRFITIFSVLLAGLVTEQLLNNFPKYKWWVVAFCFLQAFIVLFGAADYWHANARKAIDYVQNKKVKVLKVAFNTSPLTRAIETFDKGKDGRSYFTHEAEKILMRKLLYGYHFESLPLNGFRILNGRFNGIDYSDIHPNRAHMKAHIVGSKKNLFNKSLLDVLGIKYIFADLNEPVPPGLVRSALLPGNDNQIIAMYINPTAWPDAVVVSNKTRSLQPSLELGQNDKGLLFYDFRPLLGERIMGDSVTTKRDHGSIIIMLEPSIKKRTLLVSEYFRPGWKARWRSSEDMMETSVFPIYGHLIGIEAPKEALQIRLSYRPFNKTIFLYISLGTFMISVLLACVTSYALSRKRKIRG